jgi:hypothetical protein
MVSTQSITGVGFNQILFGINKEMLLIAIIYLMLLEVQKFLKSNSTDAEGIILDTVTSFDSDGFTLGSAAGNNGSGNTLVSWNWLADNTSGSSNTDGSITITVSANTTSGFSIVSYTGSIWWYFYWSDMVYTPKCLIKLKVEAS